MKLYTVNGETRSISGWAELADVSRQAMFKRIVRARKISPEEVEAELVRPKSQGRRTDLKKLKKS